jgi:predicted MFS family arabinose efflux permease
MPFLPDLNGESTILGRVRERVAPSLAIPRSGLPGLSRQLVLLMAVCTGLSAASLYYAQPLLDSIKRSLHLSTSTAGLIVSATQIGYVTGLVLLVPLGDLFIRRLLIPLMLIGIAASLVLVGEASSGAVLLAGCVLVGSLSVTAQITVALSASLASDEQRGRIVGTVMSGLLLGILLARTVAGYLADLGTWRTPFLVAAGVLVGLAVVLWRSLPTDPPRDRLPYVRLITSVVGLLRDEPLIRLRSVYGAMAFGAFSALWTPLAFLLSGSPYHYSTSTIGLFGLFGVVGALSASIAGRVADRGKAGIVTGVSAVLMLVTWIPLAFARHSLAGLIIGVIVLDFAVQGLHISNQSLIYQLRPEARSRITSAYMSLYFTGGVVGSVAVSAAYSSAGWSGASAVGAAFGTVAVVVWLFSLFAAHRGPDVPRPAAPGYSDPTVAGEASSGTV